MKLKDIEKNWSSFKKASPKTVENIKKRNALNKSKKDAKFTARTSSHVFEEFKKIALEKEIPYQTLLSHVMKEYVAGNLVDVQEVRKLFKKKVA